MSPEEKLRFKELYPFIQEGYRLAQEARDRDLANVDTKTAVASLRKAFQMASKLRETTGLISFYQALQKAR